MKEIGGIGLSANQVGIDARVFIMGVDDLLIGVFNPTITEYGEEEDSFNEGCLSFPGLSLQVKRPTSIVATYCNEKGEQVTNRFQGLTARVFQHEFDHMEGKTFQSRVSQLKWNLAIKKRNHIKAKLVKKYTQKTLIDIYNEVKDAENTDRV
jgi:peptide deformylase